LNKESPLNSERMCEVASTGCHGGGDPVNDHDSYAVGYLFQGEWCLESEPGFDWIRKIALRYYGDPERVEREIAE
jgi:hypothetical protein